MIIEGLWQKIIDIEPEDVADVGGPVASVPEKDGFLSRITEAWSNRKKKTPPTTSAPTTPTTPKTPAPKTPAPKTPKKAVAEPSRVYLRTKSPSLVVGIQSDGTDFKVERLLPGMRFVTPSPRSQEAIWEIKDQLTPRTYADGSTGGYRFTAEDGTQKWLSIADEDYKVVALQPENPTDAGETSNPPLAA